ncbi:MAG: STAS domain-containing protein [Planctomycetes bacterium]|nr:STAS domain-containing protein [Planctomycetota bacterium]
MDTNVIRSELIGADIALLSVCGEVDMSNFVELEEAITHWSEKNICSCIFDWQDARYVSSLVVGLVIRCLERAESCNGRLAFVHSEPVDRVFDLLGLRERIPSFSVIDDAVNYVRNS